MRKSAISGVLFALLASAANVLAEDLVAVVDLNFLRETDKTAAVLCLGESDDDCAVWATHYLWEARVRMVISGAEHDARFLVLHGRHALKKQNMKGVVAIMRRLEPPLPFEARYQIVGWGRKRELVCFDMAIESAPMKLSEGLEGSSSCFDAVPPDNSPERTRGR